MRLQRVLLLKGDAQQLIQPERGIAWLSSIFLAMRLNGSRPRPVNSGVRFLLNGFIHKEKFTMTADERISLISVKVERAKKHIRDLEVETRDFLDSYPYEVSIKPDPQVAEAIKYHIVSVRETPNPILAIVGDTLFNLRAALDHLAYQLALVNGTRDRKILKATSFPIFDDATIYKTNVHRKVQGMSQAAIDVIDATKPYKGGNDTLWRLHSLNNLDKHRFLITAGFHVAAFIPPPIMRVAIIKALAAQEGWPVNISDAQLEAIALSMPLSGGNCPLKVGDELKLPFDRIPDMPELKKDIRFTFEIAFNESQIAEGEPLLETLHQMVELVGNIILAFRPLLA
jgi:hypothetical protein